MQQKFRLSKRSQDRLAGVKPELRSVVERAIQITPVDFAVLEGLRTVERQKELYAQGRTKPGKIVTWTMKSKHIDGLAVDIAPVKADGSIDWNDKAAFLKVGKAMFMAAAELGVKIRWGYDWDMDGILQEKGEYDGPHFELV